MNPEKQNPNPQKDEEKAKQERKPADKKWPNKQNKNKSGGQKSQTPGSDKESKCPRFNGNALAWHNKCAELFALATHISQFKLAGVMVRPTAQAEYTAVGNRISAFSMAIAPGTVLGTGDPFNKATIDLFNRVRGKYTSTVPFQANDLGALNLAIANVISLIGAADRVLDSLGFVSFKSALTPEILHAALVGDANPATIKAGYDKDVYEAPNIKLALEVQIARLQGLFMPKMSLFDFAGWIYRHVYFEDKTELRGDMSLFRPSYIAKWSSTVPVRGATGVYASGLEYRDINTYLVSPNPHSAAILLSAITDCIDALVQDDNVRTICGWLHQYIPESPTVADLVQAARASTPENNPEMDLFVAGMTFVPVSNFNGQYVQQDVTSETLYFAMTAGTPMSTVDKWMINYDHKPTDDEIGLSMIFTSLAKDGYVYSDPFVAITEDQYRRDSSGTMVVTSTRRAIDGNSIAFGNVLRILEGRHPTTIVYTTGSGGAVNAATLYAPCEYQVPITPENAYNVHYASISSLMTVDQVKHDAR
jgi:hypothetical protein